MSVNRDARKALLFALALACGWAQALAAEPRVVVWDPGRSTRTDRFEIDAAYLDRAAEWLGDAGVAVDRLTAGQIADGAAFSAGRCDALMFEGSAIPAICIEPIKSFLDAGGVLVALCAPGPSASVAPPVSAGGPVVSLAPAPFEVTIAQDASGDWRLEPEAPRFAWQTTAIHESLGMQFNWQVDMVYSAARHTPTDLLLRYIPEAPEVHRNLLARWLVPTAGRFYPLVRSRQATGTDYTPQLFVVEHGPRRAIISSSRLWTSRDNPRLWPFGPQTVVAMARLARDLRDCAVDLHDYPAVSPTEEAGLGEPLKWRLPVGQVEPEGAEPLARWGRFDGSRLEFAPALEAGKTRALPAGAESGQVPGAIEPGAALEVALPALGAGPCYLRVRGAYMEDGAGLSLAMGGVILWNEMFVNPLSHSTVTTESRYAGCPVEFTRIVYVPPPARAAVGLTLRASGTAPVYFDALQIERRTRPARAVGFGLHTGVTLAFNGPTALTPDICRDWTWLRCSSRPWWIGPPDDPDQWARYDAHMERYLAMSDHCQMILEGTPEWAAISPERYAEGGDRKHMTPPDTDGYRAIVERIVSKYADRVEDWEIWNEANYPYGSFWRGTLQEFADLAKAMIPIVRAHDPTARVILGGMAGTTWRWTDPFVTTMVENGIVDQVDLFGFHCYAPLGLWDIGYGQVEGHLMSLGYGTEIYTNEQGPTWRGRGMTPQAQERETNTGMARLTACGVAKVTNFHAGGDAHEYGIIDEKGQPRPAYAVFADYLQLAGEGARRLDVSMTSPDASPLQGVYVAASERDSGKVVLVVNPAEVSALRAPDDPGDEFDRAWGPGWHAFWGKPEWADGKVTLTVDAGRTHCGFYRKLWFDPRKFPTVETAATNCQGRWTLEFKFADGQAVQVASSEGPGEARAAFADTMSDLAPQEAEMNFRVFGGGGSRATFDYVRFERAAVPPPAPVPVRLRLLLTRAGRYAVSAAGGGDARRQELTAQPDGDRAWGELDLDVTGRTVVTLMPVP